jgi:hypothetical protein
VRRPRLLIQYIRSYPPYLETISSIRNLRTCHAVVTREDIDVGARMILEWILEREDGVVWTGLIWLRIGTGGGPL